MHIKNHKEILKNLEGKKILVIGDLMIDHYIWGDVSRISPEAPVPVVNVEREEHRLGGAANVVFNISCLGGIPYVIGLSGDDSNASVLENEFKKNSISNLYIAKDKCRPTTIKTRLIANNQQVARIDFEKIDEIQKQTESEIISHFDNIITEMDAVLIEDYNKGLLTDSLVRHIIKRCNEFDKIVTVDPKYKNFFSYQNCTVFKPNYLELKKNMNVIIESEEEFYETSFKLLEEINSEYLIVTRGSKGLSIFTKGNDVVNIPTFAKQVFDVSGAGDTVISTLTLCLAAGVPIKDAAIIANRAAGKVCGIVGIAPVYPHDIIDSFKEEE